MKNPTLVDDVILVLGHFEHPASQFSFGIMHLLEATQRMVIRHYLKVMSKKIVAIFLNRPDDGEILLLRNPMIPLVNI